MNDEVPARGAKSGRSTQRTRRLSLVSRVRATVRRFADRLLGTDVLWSGLFVAVTLSIVAAQRCGTGYEQFAVGEVAPYDIRATYDIDVVDEALTDERRHQARVQILDVYVHDSERRSLLANQLTDVFEDGRSAIEIAAQRGEPRSGALERALGDRVPVDVLRTLSRTEFDAGLERTLTSAVSLVMSRMIIGNKALLEREPAIMLTQLPGRATRRMDDYDATIDTRAARDELQQLLRREMKLGADEQSTIIRFAQSYIDANVYLDSEATYRRREQAAAAVPPVLLRVASGDLMIRKGERITEDALAKLDAARKQSPGPLDLVEALGLMLMLCMLAFFIYRYSSYHQRNFRKITHLHALLVLMLLSLCLLTQAILWLAGEIAEDLSPPFGDLEAYHYLIPLGAGAILVALLANGRIATVYSAFAAVVFGGIRGADFYLMLWAFVVQLSGVYAIVTYRERAALLRAGLVVGGMGAVSAVAIEILRGSVEPISSVMFAASLAFVGGAVGVGLLISFSLPLLEWLFNVLTDIRLLELSNVNTPLLSEMAVKAPGSYNHSLVVGTLAEEGAKAIGANSLLCRVAAFYHDIGKMNHPEYYVENQRGVNPHDRLAPSMSALIITSHVKDGIKMAREAGLPEQIVDMIPQHHGTKKLTFFYEKAKQRSDPSLGPVNEEDFRYPGPKPQTREGAIFMIADGVEAAARTVEDPTPNRLKEMIRKVTNSIVLDGQFDQCDLTFADLERIQQALLRLLVSMHHRRVDYPGFEFGRPRAVAKAPGDGSGRKVVRGA
ncbi:MAG TPA: HDIG domain-containing protein [Candidatus Polarisedimenticolaceae bacterium]|nr:HDIG domain-containing protein [Candidatus Polarisedimenticolaceae bacterium]